MPFSKTCSNICSRLCYTVIILAFVAFSGFIFCDMFVPLSVFSPKDASLTKVDLTPTNAEYRDLTGKWTSICYGKNYMATFTEENYSCVAPTPIQPEYEYIFEFDPKKQNKYLQRLDVNCMVF